MAKKNCENNSGFMVLKFVIGSGEQDSNHASVIFIASNKIGCQIGENSEFVVSEMVVSDKFQNYKSPIFKNFLNQSDCFLMKNTCQRKKVDA